MTLLFYADEFVNKTIKLVEIGSKRRRTDDEEKILTIELLPFDDEGDYFSSTGLNPIK